MLLDSISSPSAYSSILYTIFGISLPIHLFGAYCVLYKTPVLMKSVKLALFNLNFWAATLDFSITLFMQPYYCTPANAGLSLGLWSWTSVPTIVPALVTMLTFRLVPVSIIAMFENRYFVLFVRKGAWRYVRYPFLIANHILAIAYCISVYFDIPVDQEYSRRLVFQKFPQACELVASKSIIFVVYIGEDYWVNIREPSLNLMVMIEVLFFAVLLRVKMKQAVKIIQSSVSRDTLEKQKKFIRALNLQIAIPMLIIFLPATFAAFLGAQSSIQQGLDNLLTIITSFHGVSATILMIYLQKPYRDAFFVVFCNRKKPMELKGSGYFHLQSYLDVM